MVNTFIFVQFKLDYVSTTVTLISLKIKINLTATLPNNSIRFSQ